MLAYDKIVSVQRQNPFSN